MLQLTSFNSYFFAIVCPLYLYQASTLHVPLYAHSCCTNCIPLGEKDIEIDMEKQRVYVKSTLSSDELLETIKKAGKPCSYIGVASA